MKSAEFSIWSGSDMIGSAGGQLNLLCSTEGGLQGQASLYSFPALFSDVLGKGKDSTLENPLEEQDFLTAFACMHVLLEQKSHYVAQVGLELLRSSEPPAFAP